jgi:hypothetical protein
MLHRPYRSSSIPAARSSFASKHRRPSSTGGSSRPGFAREMRLTPRGGLPPPVDIVSTCVNLVRETGLLRCD